MLYVDSTSHIGCVLPGSQCVVTIGHQLIGSIVSRSYGSFRCQVVSDVGIGCVLRLQYRGCEEEHWQKNDSMAHRLVALEFLAKHDVDEGLKQNLDVEPPRAVLQVIQVQLQSAQHLLQRVGIAVV